MNDARRCRILVIDDDPAIRDDFRKILGAGEDTAAPGNPAAGPAGDHLRQTIAAEPIEIDCAGCGAEGLSLIEKAVQENRPYTMAFVDIRMPGWDGLETATRIWQIQPEVVVVFCTAYSDYRWTDLAERFGESRCFLLLNKPFDTIELRQLASFVADRRRMEDRLRDSKSKFHALFELSPDAVMLLDGQDVLKCNGATLRMFGCRSRVELLGTSILRWSPSQQPGGRDSRSAAGDTLAAAMKAWPCHYEWTFRRTGGSNFPAEVSLGPVELEGKRYLQAVIRDITERKRAEKELQKYREHLEELVQQRTNQLSEALQRLKREIAEREMVERELVHAQKLEAVGQLAAGIAHEINTPSQYVGDNTRFLQEAFTSIDGVLDRFERLLQAAKDGGVSPELTDEIDIAVREADLDYLTDEIPQAIRQSLEGLERVTSIVGAMKKFSHPGSGRKQAVDLNDAIQSTLTVSRNEWRYVADVVTDLRDDLPMVRCLPGDINQVLLNLIVNAAQAIANVVGDGSQGKGTITIRTRCKGDWVEIRIRDTGTGIPEQIRSRVFDHFFTTKDIGKGTGQGLTIAYSIVAEKHGGTITFDTEVGKGTTFVIRLPLDGEAGTGDRG